MTDNTAMIEAVAEALFADQWQWDDGRIPVEWGDGAPVEREAWRTSATAAIAAARPFIVAERDAEIVVFLRQFAELVSDPHAAGLLDAARLIENGEV